MYGYWYHEEGRAAAYNNHNVLGTRREKQEHSPWQASELAESKTGMHGEENVSDSNPAGFKSVSRTISECGWPMSQEEEIFCWIC